MFPTQGIITIVAAAILCVSVLRITGNNNSTSRLIKLTTALFMLLTVIRIFSYVELKDFADILTNVNDDADLLVTNGEFATQKEIEDIIKDRVEAYILDRAQQYGVELEVQIKDIDQETMMPMKVYLQGRISPIVKKQFGMEIENDLGIPEEKQVWD